MNSNFQDLYLSCDRDVVRTCSMLVLVVPLVGAGFVRRLHLTIEERSSAMESKAVKYTDAQKRTVKHIALLRIAGPAKVPPRPRSSGDSKAAK